MDNGRFLFGLNILLHLTRRQCIIKPPHSSNRTSVVRDQEKVTTTLHFFLPEQGNVVPLESLGSKVKTSNKPLHVDDLILGPTIPRPVLVPHPSV